MKPGQVVLSNHISTHQSAEHVEGYLNIKCAAIENKVQSNRSIDLHRYLEYTLKPRSPSVPQLRATLKVNEPAE